MKGLDIFYEKPDEARENVLSGLKKVLNANQVRPRAVLTISFLDAKADEINQIFTEGDMTIRRNDYNILVNIDPTKREKFQPMIK
jgi:hypothetical protein